MNTVTYTIELSKENAAKIDAINTILMCDEVTMTATKEAAKEIKEVPLVKKSQPAMDMKEFKKAIKEFKDDLGENVVKRVLVEDFEADEKLTLAKMLSALDDEQYTTVILTLEAQKEVMIEEAEEAEEAEEVEDDDGLGDEPESIIDPEIVKDALRAYAKEDREAARELMKSAGAATLSEVEKLSQEKLKEILKKAI